MKTHPKPEPAVLAETRAWFATRHWSVVWRQAIAETVQRPEEVEEEIRYLTELLRSHDRA